MKRYRIVPIVLGNRCKAWKLQHKTWIGWIDTVFENGKVRSTDKNELQDLINHLTVSEIN